jgi:endonuclease YncB( thermonuclease family)
MRYVAQRRGAWLALLVLGMCAAVLCYFQPAEPPISGRAAAVDGDTLRVRGVRVRLLGIDAPELAQACTAADGSQWLCGEAARRQMVAMLGDGAAVVCHPHGHDRYGRVLARCESPSTDLGAAMVTAGLAVADGDYFHEEALASAAKIGIWAGSFTPPRQWRVAHAVDAGEPNFIQTIKDWFR